MVYTINCVFPWQNVTIYFNQSRVGESPEHRSRFVAYLRSLAFSKDALATYLETEGLSPQQGNDEFGGKDLYNTAEHKANAKLMSSSNETPKTRHFLSRLTHELSAIEDPIPAWVTSVTIKLEKEDDNVLLFGGPLPRTTDEAETEKLIAAYAAKLKELKDGGMENVAAITKATELAGPSNVLKREALTKAQKYSDDRTYRVVIKNVSLSMSKVFYAEKVTTFDFLLLLFYYVAFIYCYFFRFIHIIRDFWSKGMSSGCICTSLVALGLLFRQVSATLRHVN